MLVFRGVDVQCFYQWIFQVPVKIVKGGRDYITPQKAIYKYGSISIYKWYINGIYCQLGDYMPPIPPFKGT